MQQALIGVDIGTTNIKAVAFSVDGQTIGASSSPTPRQQPKKNWIQFEADDIWQCICLCLQGLIKELPDDYELTGISFSSMAEAAFALNTQGQVISPAIAWFDNRVLPQLQWWQNNISDAETSGITGLHPATAAGILRLLWLRDEQAPIYKTVASWLNMADYGIHKLSGASVTDYSLASRMMIMDLSQKQWSDTLLDKIEIDKSLFAELVPSGMQVGTVTSEAAEQTGLPLGLPVCSGGHDHVCASLGLGITDSGQVFDSMGTAEVIMASFEKPILEESISQLGIDQGCHVIPDRYYAMTGLHFSGSSLDWICKSLALNYNTLVSLAANAPLGSGGVSFFSNLRKADLTENDPYASAAFKGVTIDTSPEQLARAVMEGIAYEYQQVFNSVIKAFSLSPTALVASGGSTRNATLMDIKANVSGLPITIPKVDEAACLGAALLAGIGAGVYKDFSDAKEQVHYVSRIVKCDDAINLVYKKLYQETYLNI